MRIIIIRYLHPMNPSLTICLRPLFRVWINVLMLKQLKLSWGKMLEVYIATDSATDSINLRHCSKAMLTKSLNFVLACSAGFSSGA